MLSYNLHQGKCRDIELEEQEIMYEKKESKMHKRKKKVILMKFKKKVKQIQGITSKK